MLKNKIESSVWDNQKSFIDLWKKENPNGYKEYGLKLLITSETDIWYEHG